MAKKPWARINDGAHLDKNGNVVVHTRAPTAGEFAGRAILGTAEGAGKLTKFLVKHAVKEAKKEVKKDIKKKAEQAIPMILGAGDYKVFTNSITGASKVAADLDLVPSFKTDQRSVTIRHREYLGDVLSGPVSGAFNITSYTVNPGILPPFLGYQ